MGIAKNYIIHSYYSRYKGTDETQISFVEFLKSILITLIFMRNVWILIGKAKLKSI